MIELELVKHRETKNVAVYYSLLTLIKQEKIERKNVEIDIYHKLKKKRFTLLNLSIEYYSTN